MSKKLFWGFIILCLSALAAQAEIVIVAPGESIQAALDSAQPGDIVLIQGVHMVTGAVRISTDHVTLAGAPGAVIDGTHAGAVHLVSVWGDYDTIENLEIRTSEKRLISGGGTEAHTATGITIRNCRIHGGATTSGIYLQFTTDARIDSNEVWDTDSHGIYFQGASVNGKIRWNDIHHTGLKGAAQIHLNAGGTFIGQNVLLEGNRIHDGNGKAVNFLNQWNGRGENNLIYNNNLTSGGRGTVTFGSDDDQGSQVGVATGAFQNVWVNNTILSPNNVGIELVNASAYLGNKGAIDNVIFNNIILSDHPIKDNGEGTLLDSNVTGPLSMSVLDADYLPLEGGPAHNTGLFGLAGYTAPGFDLVGNPRSGPPAVTIDIGALERQESAPSPPVVPGVWRYRTTFEAWFDTTGTP